MKTIFWNTFLYILSILFVLFYCTAAYSIELTQKQMGLLEKGEVIVDKSVNNSKGRIRAMILIRASVGLVWSVLTDYETAPEFMPGLISCKVLNSNGNIETIEQTVKFSMLIPEVTYVIKSHYQKNQRIDFEKISGDLRTLEGSWILKYIDHSQKTVIVYSVYVDPHFFIPQWLVQFVLRKDLPEMLYAIRKRVAEINNPNRSCR